MKLFSYLALALILGYMLAVFLDPSFPSIFEILEKF